MSITGFLNDLTLVINSCSGMFFGKYAVDNEIYQFEDAVREDLNEFVTKNIDKYLALVQDRIDIETGRGDSGILLKALDKLNIRLVAMKCSYCEIDMTKIGLDIIINAAKQEISSLNNKINE